MSVAAGAAWCTYFSGTLRGLKFRRLRYAYRAPSFFTDEWLRAGQAIEFLRFDDNFETSSLDGSTDALAQTVDLLYVTSHGTNNSSGYRAILHGSDWKPALSGFGSERPTVVVFDTCDLLDGSDPAWSKPWEVSSVGLALRLVLGFSTPATIGQATSIRGRAFVQNLVAGHSFVDAWTGAVIPTSYQGTDQPVAIAFGDSSADASSVLSSASLTSMPAPRTVAVPTVIRFP